MSPSCVESRVIFLKHVGSTDSVRSNVGAEVAENAVVAHRGGAGGPQG